MLNEKYGIEQTNATKRQPAKGAPQINSFMECPPLLFFDFLQNKCAIMFLVDSELVYICSNDDGMIIKIRSAVLHAQINIEDNWWLEI
jgi:hypothetical protein